MEWEGRQGPREALQSTETQLNLKLRQAWAFRRTTASHSQERLELSGGHPSRNGRWPDFRPRNVELGLTVSDAVPQCAGNGFAGTLERLDEFGRGSCRQAPRRTDQPDHGGQRCLSIEDRHCKSVESDHTF